ncbi:syntaxin-like isoform X2 [Anneissia japonica]|uniref:syntaxin-like isoform X1 n=1 Tax=Anneissia japonica TaxID=1529436 RepID=UPI001425AA4A|nr:syntaxin-like isoform X1 [Anneissia japonica]XP_033111535.1 syntaxin-like isoform X2 [Anneissia japonica]
MNSRPRHFTRDRLGSLQRLANIEDGTYTVYLSSGGILEEFFEKVAEIQCKIDVIADLADEVESNYSKIELSSKHRKDLEEQVKEQADLIKRHSRETNVLLKGIEAEIGPTDATFRNTTEYRMKQMQYRYLSWHFSETITTFKNSQIRQKEKFKGKLKREIEITEQNFSDDQMEEMIENGNISTFAFNIIGDTTKAKQDLELIVGRHNLILKIEQSITEIHDMFMDFALLVESQGVMVDNIERNVVETQEFVISGGKHLKNAHRYRDKVRRKKIYCIGCCLILLIVVAIILLIKYVLIT